MCQGTEFRDVLRAPASASGAARAELAATNAELAAVRARLAESVAELERERARAADLLRRLTQTYAERDRLRKLSSVMDLIKARLNIRRLRDPGA